MQNVGEFAVRHTRDIAEHPERHEHDREAFAACCTLPGETEPDQTLVEAHHVHGLFPAPALLSELPELVAS